MVDVSSRAAAIDAGTVSVTLRAHIGTGDDASAGVVGVDLLDANGAYLGILELGPIFTGDWTLVPVTTTLPLPTGTRLLAVHLIALGGPSGSPVTFDLVALELSP